MLSDVQLTSEEKLAVQDEIVALASRLHSDLGDLYVSFDRLLDKLCSTVDKIGSVDPP